MSNRTIVEFNHDMAGFIDRSPTEFVDRLSNALRSGAAEDWKPLEGFGVRFGAMGHHSSVRYCGVHSSDEPGAWNSKVFFP